MRHGAPFGPLGTFLPNLRSAAVRQKGLEWGMTNSPKDYFVITYRRGEHPDLWSWEILRKSKPLGIKMTGDGFRSETAAKFAGKQALQDFLSDLAKEEKPKNK